MKKEDADRLVEEHRPFFESRGAGLTVHVHPSGGKHVGKGKKHEYRQDFCIFCRYPHGASEVYTTRSSFEQHANESRANTEDKGYWW